VHVRHVPLAITLSTICITLVFGVHCNGGGSDESGGSGFSEAQLYCQAAAIQLQDCCEGYIPAKLMCDRASSTNTQTSSCGGESAVSTTTYPTLSGAESQCVVNETCETLRATKVCERAAQAVDRGSPTTTHVSEPQGCASETYYEDAEVEAGDVPMPVDAGPVCP
jgi:hypothetical protein